MGSGRDCGHLFALAGRPVRQGKGRHFDPRIIEVFQARLNEFVNVQKEYSE